MKCLKCNNEHNGNFGSGKYCSRQCANSRIRTKEIKEKIKKSKKEFDKKNYFLIRDRYTEKPSKCILCNEILSFENKRRKLCSKECITKYFSKLMTQRLMKRENRNNYGRGKKSYLELSFESWLNKKNISYETEKAFKNHITNKNYFADFVFEDKKLIIELDGTQHLKTINEDKIRDNYILEKYGYNVLRITHDEYKKKSKINLVCELLNVPFV